MSFEILRQQAFPGAKYMMHTKFGAYRTNRLKVIKFILNFSFSSAAILDSVKKIAGLTLPTKISAKFGENRTKCSEVIQVLVNFKTAAGGHLLFLNFTISGRMHVAGATMNQIKFRKDRINGSKFRDFSFP